MASTNALTALCFSPGVTPTAMVSTNPLDEQQQRIVVQEKSAKLMSETMAQLTSQRQYVLRASSVEERLKEAAGRSLSGCTVRDGTILPEDIATRTALSKR